jgi:hypothetical protein
MSNVSAPRGPGPRKPLLPISRILVLIFVAAAAVVIVLELRTRAIYNSSYEAIDAAIAAGEESGEGFFKKDVDPLLRGSPVREADPGGGETFTWRGILRPYKMRLSYGPGDFVERIEPL